MANTRGNAHEADSGRETWVSDSAPKDTAPTVAQAERGDAWQSADAARVRANEALAQAEAAKAEADDLERQAIAADEGVEHEQVDPLAGTWEGAVSRPAASDAPADAEDEK